jgi:hypothetical protein
LEKMKYESLMSLKYNHPPKILGGSETKPKIHPLVKKYNPEQHHKKIDDMSSPVIDEKEKLRTLRLKFFNS